MNGLKTLLVGLALAGTLFLSTATSCFSQTVGIVDPDKILDNYSKAQGIEADLKVKEAEIQKFLAEAQKKVKDATTPVEKNNLEKQLTEELKTKHGEFRKMQLEQSKKIYDDILAAIKTVAKEQKLDLVFAKGALFVGGTDITESVLKSLNASSGGSAKK